MGRLRLGLAPEAPEGQGNTDRFGHQGHEPRFLGGATASHHQVGVAMQLTDALVDVARTVGERPEVEGPVRQELLRLADALAEHGPVDAAEIATVDRSLRELTECEVEQKPAPEVAQPSGAEVARLVATEFAVTGASRAEVAEAIRPLIPAGEIRAMVDSVLPRGSRRVGAA